MKRPISILATLLLITACARADEAITAKMLALFPKFDADHNGALTTDEQAKAVAYVQKAHGPQWARTIETMFDTAAAPDKSVPRDQWKKAVATYDQVPEKQTARIPMRDGARLATDIYLPRGTGAFPVVLARTPYSRLKHDHGAPGYQRQGIACVVQDMRGRFDSEGENLPFIGCGWAGHQDGADTLAWLKQQPWCNGRIATIGASAGGITQNLMAGADTNSLAAQHIVVAAASLYHDITYTGGALRKADVENWTTGNKFDARALELMRAHPDYDDYWRLFDTTLKFPVMNVPAIHQGGWFDMFAQATIDEFIGRQYHGAPGSRGKQKLIMGPWDHGGPRKEPVGQLKFPDNQLPPACSSGPWLDHHLRGTDNGIEKQLPVAYYVMGDTLDPRAPGNQWRYAPDWPVPATPTPFYLSPQHKLTPTQPGPATPTDPAYLQYTFNPTSPCPTIGGCNLTIDRGPRNQNPIESRPDVILFTTDPLTAPLEITGRVKAGIHISSSAPDTDLSIRLCDVYPDGKAYLIAEGMLRLRHRNTMEKSEPLTPGKIEQVTIDCWSTSIIFNKGHRIRATITSSNYPRFDINPGTGRPWTDGCPTLAQTNRIYCDAAHPSHLILPVVHLQTAAATH